MPISKENREFIDSLIDYYISEAGSYKQIAEQFVPEIESVADAAFGIIVGCVYSSFLETYRNQQLQLGLEEMTEFNKILKGRAAAIKKAIIDPEPIEAAATTIGSMSNTKQEAAHVVVDNGGSTDASTAPDGGGDAAAGGGGGGGGGGAGGETGGDVDAGAAAGTAPGGGGDAAAGGHVSR